MSLLQPFNNHHERGSLPPLWVAMLNAYLMLSLYEDFTSTRIHTIICRVMSTSNSPGEWGIDGLSVLSFIHSWASPTQTILKLGRTNLIIDLHLSSDQWHEFSLFLLNLETSTWFLPYSTVSVTKSVLISMSLMKEYVTITLLPDKNFPICKSEEVTLCHL